MMRPRTRAVLAIAVTWGVSLASITAAILLLGLATHLLPSSVFTPGTVAQGVLRNFVAGTVIGGAFATLLGSAERRHTLATLPMRRVAGWGALAAAPLPLIAAAFSGVMIPASVLLAGTLGFCAVGGAMATTTVRLARRAALPGTQPQPRLGA